MFLNYRQDKQIQCIFGIIFISIMKKTGRYLKYMAAPIAISLLIFVGTCLLGTNDIPKLPKLLPWDKIGHFGMFLLLSAVSLYNYYFLHNGNPKIWKWMFWGIVIPSIYGGAIELMQEYFFSYRSAEMADYVADILGSLSAALLTLILLKRKTEE